MFLQYDKIPIERVRYEAAAQQARRWEINNPAASSGVLSVRGMKTSPFANAYPL